MERTLDLAGYKCTTLHYSASGIPIVFLHGLSYTAEIWQRIGITELLIQKKIPFLALDMPYGLKTKCQPKTRNPTTNIAVVAESVKTLFGLVKPVLVGASIGGRMALRYATMLPVTGLFLIAPASVLEGDLVKSYRAFNFPVKIIWGSKDNIVSEEDVRTLAQKIPHAELVVYEGASHSAYKDEPERFQKDLLELYASAT